MKYITIFISILISLFLVFFILRKSAIINSIPTGMVYVEGSDNIKSFFMDESPVTVGQFREFVKKQVSKPKRINLEMQVFSILKKVIGV
jgi:hypothetical protein